MEISKRVCFLGAGSSIADGYPWTSDLLYAVSASALKSKSRLGQLLDAVYGVKEPELSELNKRWNGRKHGERLPLLPSIPDIIELLSILDLAMTEGLSFGLFGERKLEGNGLSRIRRQLQDAIVEALQGISTQKETHAMRFVKATSEYDTIVTTNWDSLIDRAMAGAGLAIDYGSPFAKEVDLKGNPVQKSHERGHGRRRLLKLHGSLNWLNCKRCHRLFANPFKDIAGLGARVAKNTIHNQCECGDRMHPLIVTPSFTKSYSNVHLSNIWNTALQSLEDADEWHFAGYSFPKDDLMIRTLILRALAIRRGCAETRPLKVHLHFHTRPPTDGSTESLFRNTKVEKSTGGFQGMIDILSDPGQERQ